MQILETSYRSFKIDGGCTECISDKPKATYEKIYVSDGSYVDSKIITEILIPLSCNSPETLDCRQVRKCNTIEVKCKLTTYSCIIKEKYFQIATGEWKASREVLYGRYRGQNMIDVRGMIQ